MVVRIFMQNLQCSSFSKLEVEAANGTSPIQNYKRSGEFVIRGAKIMMDFQRSHSWNKPNPFVLFSISFDTMKLSYFVPFHFIDCLLGALIDFVRIQL